MDSLPKGVIRNGRVEVAEPIDLPEGTKVVIASGASNPDDGPLTPEETARVLTAMHRLQPLDIPEPVGADLDAWQGRLNRRGIDEADSGIEDVFR